METRHLLAAARKELKTTDELIALTELETEPDDSERGLLISELAAARKAHKKLASELATARSALKTAEDLLAEERKARK